GTASYELHFHGSIPSSPPYGRLRLHLLNHGSIPSSPPYGRLRLHLLNHGSIPSSPPYGRLRLHLLHHGSIPSSPPYGRLRLHLLSLRLGGEGSNLDSGLQRTLCCRYTTPDSSTNLPTNGDTHERCARTARMAPDKPPPNRPRARSSDPSYH